MPSPGVLLNAPIVRFVGSMAESEMVAGILARRPVALIRVSVALGRKVGHRVDQRNRIADMATEVS